jgi:hypothetical protein
MRMLREIRSSAFLPARGIVQQRLKGLFGLSTVRENSLALAARASGNLLAPFLPRLVLRTWQMGAFMGGVHTPSNDPDAAGTAHGRRVDRI